MALMITKIKNDKTLLWVGYEGFDPIQVQKSLNASGMTLEEIQDDKWAVLGSFYGKQNIQESNDG